MASPAPRGPGRPGAPAGRRDAEGSGCPSWDAEAIEPGVVAWLLLMTCDKLIAFLAAGTGFVPEHHGYSRENRLR